jgi:hypothetical protein
MGGRGSGRHWHWNAKSTITDYRSLDVRRWARDGLLEPGRRFGWQWSIDGEQVASIQAQVEHGQVRLIYRSRDHGEEWESLDYPVRLLSHPCHFGGYREWFACPAQGCGRRVAKLYGGRIFACRHCYQLAYPSQREAAFQRAERRADKIRERLGWADDEEEYVKPKGMHWQTYHRLVDELEAWQHRSDVGMMEYTIRLIGGLDAL